MKGNLYTLWQDCDKTCRRYTDHIYSMDRKQRKKRGKAEKDVIIYYSIISFIHSVWVWMWHLLVFTVYIVYIVVAFPRFSLSSSIVVRPIVNMNTWTKDFWVANADECKKTLMEPGNWEKVIQTYKY